MRMPSAKPRRSRNQPAAIFMPGGYTHASATPVRKRKHDDASAGEPATSTAALAGRAGERAEEEQDARVQDVGEIRDRARRACRRRIPPARPW